MLNFSIPAGDNAAVFEHKCTLLKKRAAKCGVTFTCKRGDDTSMAHPTLPDTLVALQTYTIDTTVVQVEGWEFVGTLDYVTAPGSILVNAVPGCVVPTEFQNRANTCDHCQTARNRKMVVVMRSTESGEHIAVGSTCCKDFIGHDVTATLKFLEGLRALESSIGEAMDSLESSGGGSFVPCWDAVDTLRQAAAIVRLEGYHNSQGDAKSTKAKVHDVFNPPLFFGKLAEQQRREYNEWCTSVAVTDTDRDTARAAMEWILEQDTTENNYLHNLQAICKSGTVTYKSLGYAVSLIPAYQRAARDAEYKAQREAEKTAAADCPTGRLEIEGEILSIKLQASDYGETLKMLVRHASGFKVWGSVPAAISYDDDLKGKTVHFTATVTPSNDDTTFGFFKRPSKAALV